MSDVTIEKALEMKNQLAREILTLIRGYEKACIWHLLCGRCLPLP